MSRHLPPLNQLRAFEAAARLGSFKAAGDELNVTHAAISHQVKALEDTLNVTLFQRLTRGVRPTQEATAYAELLGQALDLMDTATRSIAGEARKPLRISSAPFFGNRMLLPAMPDFHRQHPEIDINVDLDFGLVDFAGGEADCALRYGAGKWPGLHSELIYRDIITPVAAPSLVKGLGLPLDPTQITQLPLATTKAEESDWEHWLAENGVHDTSGLRYHKLDNRAIALDYALVGNGAALADLRMVAQEIEGGRLVRLHPSAVAWTRSMFLVWPEQSRHDPRLQIFLDWLRSMIRVIDQKLGIRSA